MNYEERAKYHRRAGTATNIYWFTYLTTMFLTGVSVYSLGQPMWVGFLAALLWGFCFGVFHLCLLLGVIVLGVFGILFLDAVRTAAIVRGKNVS